MGFWEELPALVCPACEVSADDPRQPIRMTAHTGLTADALVNFVRFTCKCGWFIDENTDDLRTKESVLQFRLNVLIRAHEERKRRWCLRESS